MEERFVEIETPSGRMATFVTHPEQDGPFPAVVIYMDIWGVREELFEIARRVGTVGYYCLVPDFYYRQGKVRHEFRDARMWRSSQRTASSSIRSSITSCPGARRCVCWSWPTRCGRGASSAASRCATFPWPMPERPGRCC